MLEGKQGESVITCRIIIMHLGTVCKCLSSQKWSEALARLNYGVPKAIALGNWLFHLQFSFILCTFRIRVSRHICMLIPKHHILQILQRNQVLSVRYMELHFWLEKENLAFLCDFSVHLC